MLKKTAKSRSIGLAAAGLCLCLLAAPVCVKAGDHIPAAYAGIYQMLEQTLDAETVRLQRADKATVGTRPLISVDLLIANSNRGPALLQPMVMDAVRLSLDRFRNLGIQSVKFAVQYPLFRPDFPHAAEYLAFYKQVVTEAHARGLKVMPHVTVLFADTPFSPFKGIYRGLNLERFKREYRDMVHLIVRELHPDFLSLLTEPDTHARLTGLQEIDDPQTVVDIVRYTLQGLDRGKTLIGAGSGSWSPAAFAEALTGKTDIDFLCIHVYPVTGPFLSNARAMARIARASGKQIFVDEAWLYKILRPGQVDGIAATADVFRLDSYSFWQPLDQKFITVMLRLAETEHIGLVSFFWSSQFFGYLDYSPEMEQMPYRELTQQFNRVVYRNMLDGKLSVLGEFMQREISGRRAKAITP
ncbi:MAG: hypothetical protein JW943_00400 [Deltaproteobacteria bacterium]|nr:hypothetical protein [Deltaproteobacteria bacterium]